LSNDTEEILTRIDGRVGFVTLNRPKAINSLTQGMVTAMDATLTDWADDDRVGAVVVAGAGDRGLCAGGDVVAIYHSAQADGAQARRFWFDEYRLNARIGRFPKPYVALMDGIVMGGGLGIGMHGSVRVVTDTSKIAMPEVGIGLIPDVGGTLLLSRTPGLLGLHVALTGAPFSGADAIALGFADHYVPHAQLQAFSTSSELGAQREWIDDCFAGETITDIIAALRSHDEGPAHDAADLISTRSPIALAVTLASVRRAAGYTTLEEALIAEYRVSCAAVQSHDLVEGIRAQVVDKDRNPKWSPASLAAVTDEDVAAYFQPGNPDLTF
jgi:enoyl-CoA hydratase